MSDTAALLLSRACGRIRLRPVESRAIDQIVRNWLEKGAIRPGYAERRDTLPGSHSQLIPDGIAHAGNGPCRRRMLDQASSWWGR